MFKLIDNLSLTVFLLVALSVGLAPFFPEPHVWEKLKMLAAGELTRPIDIFDLALHGLPWLFLGLKGTRLALGHRSADS
jgi:hypothetical protein